jgi:DNA-binding GntR family transcriptional regulator
MVNAQPPFADVPCVAMADALPARFGPGPRPVVQTSVVDQVIREVRRSVLDGSLPPGSPVSITELSNRLNVSHIPVREALRRLEGEGLIELRRSRSAVVAPLSREDLEDVFRLRGLLEADAYARAVKLFTPEEIEELEAAYDALTIRPGDDAESLAERHTHFHRLLAAPAASEWDWRLLDIVWQANDRYLYLILGELVERAPNQFRDNHKRFMDAVRERSPKGARAAVMGHLKDGIRLIGPQLERSATEG